MRKPRNTKAKRDKIGKIINGWCIESYHGYVNQTAMFNCLCTGCGKEKKQSVSNLKQLKNLYCTDCQKNIAKIRQKLLLHLIQSNGI